MKKRIFAFLAMVVVLIPLACISASAFTMSPDYDYAGNAKWGHFKDYVRSTYTERESNEGLSFLDEHISYYLRDYSKYAVETMFCGLDLDLYLNVTEETEIVPTTEGHFVDFSKSYGDWMMAESTTLDDLGAYSICCSYDTVWSLRLLLNGEVESFHSYGEVRVQVGKKAPRVGDPEIRMINVYLRVKNYKEVDGAVSQVMLQYWQRGSDSKNYYFELAKVDVRSYQGDGFYNTEYWDVDMKDCIVSFLNMGVFQPKGSYSSEFIGTLLGFNPKNSANGMLGMSKWFYPREFFAGADMIYENVLSSSASYVSGYDTGYGYGYEEGNIKGFTDGKAEGMRVSEKGSHDLQNMIISIFEAPSVLMDSMLDFDIFGINIAGFVKALLTMSVVAVIVYFVFKLVRG